MATETNALALIGSVVTLDLTRDTEIPSDGERMQLVAAELVIDSDESFQVAADIVKSCRARVKAHTSGKWGD